MYFRESDSLLNEGIGGQEAVRAVDGFLSSVNRSAVFDTATVAQVTAQPDGVVGQVLEALLARGVLAARQQYRCPEKGCGTLNPTEQVEQAREDGEEYPCQGPCESDLTGKADLEAVTSYQVVALPT